MWSNPPSSLLYERRVSVMISNDSRTLVETLPALPLTPPPLVVVVVVVTVVVVVVVVLHHAKVMKW